MNPRLLLLIALCWPGLALAEPPKVAVLAFELNDLTLTPNRPDALRRAASIAPLLDQALADAGTLQTVAVDAEAQRQADRAHGYLFDRPPLAAELGAAAGADWVVVGRMHKPTDLFIYLIAHLVEVDSGRLHDELIVELKGPSDKGTRRGVNRLADKIRLAIPADT